MTFQQLRDSMTAEEWAALRRESAKIAAMMAEQDSEMAIPTNLPPVPDSDPASPA